MRHLWKNSGGARGGFTFKMSVKPNGRCFLLITCVSIQVSDLDKMRPFGSSSKSFRVTASVKILDHTKDG